MEPNQPGQSGPSSDEYQADDDGLMPAASDEECSRSDSPPDEQDNNTNHTSMSDDDTLTDIGSSFETAASIQPCPCMDAWPHSPDAWVFHLAMEHCHHWGEKHMATIRRHLSLPAETAPEAIESFLSENLTVIRHLADGTVSHPD